MIPERIAIIADTLMAITGISRDEAVRLAYRADNDLRAHNYTIEKRLAALSAIRLDEEGVRIPRQPTEAMMQAGLYHSSADAEWADVFTMWQAMFDACTLDGGTSESAPAALSRLSLEGGDDGK